jgi:hypothetical protein
MVVYLEEVNCEPGRNMDYLDIKRLDGREDKILRDPEDLLSSEMFFRDYIAAPAFHG